MARDEVRRRILLTAGEIFAARGYQGATVRDICHQADVNVAAVNYYFGDKERLYIDAVKHARALIEERWPLPEWSDATLPEEKLEAFVGTFVHRLISRETAEWQMRLILREVMEPTRACEEMVQESFRPFFGVLLQILSELLPETTAPHQLHQMGLSVISQCVFYLAHRRIVRLIIDEDELEQHFDVETLAKHIASFSLAALRQFANGADRKISSSKSWSNG
jgi:AcrR family transcriptional regulator